MTYPFTASTWQKGAGRGTQYEKFLEAIFADKDSDNEDFDCGSDVEFVPSEDNSACEESGCK